jgi:colanic acid/amylovoran biosynthesis glycosyltransferase
MKKNIIVHLVTPYLFHTGSWVYSQIKGSQIYSPVVFTQYQENLDQFPLGNIVSADNLSFPKRFLNRFYRKTTGNFGLFFSSEVKKYNPILFHAHMGFEGVRWLKFVKSTGLPLITTFYGQDVSKLGKIPYWLNRYQQLFRYGTYFLAEGNYLKEQLVNLGCPQNKVLVQHLGVDIENYPTKNKLGNEKIIILQVSTFREKKGIEYSLRAIALVKAEHPEIEFHLIGSGDTPEAQLGIIRLIEELGIKDCVKLLGAVPHELMLKEMTMANIFLHPSITASDGDNEGEIPVSIIEASAIGLPVVSTFHADIPEVVVDGKSGFLSKERDHKTLSHFLLRLIKEPNMRVEMGEAGKKHVSNNYSLTIQNRKLQEIYNLFD